MSDTYYSYQDVKVKIAHRLFKMDGWKVYGYHADNSDAMTDYYDPAYWGGVAEKNGYILVVDGYSEKKEPEYITKRTTASAQADAETAAKIAKLEQMTQARGASAQEEATAQAKIEALRNKKAEADGIAEEKVLYCPAHKQNPPRCNWHIEKDGIILDKGNGILKFASVPDISGSGYAHEVEDWQKFNTQTEEEWKAAYIAYEVSRWGEHERERATQNADYSYNRAVEKYALLDKFNALIARWNNICGGMVSNGSGEDGYIYEEITVTEYKTELKPQETAGEIKEGQCFIVKSGFNYGHEKGYVYRIHEHYTRTDGKKTYIAYRLGKGYKKERTGAAARGNDWTIYDTEKFLKWFEKGSLAFCELVEVKTPYEVKKVVKKAVQTESRNAEATQSETTATAEEMTTEEEKTTENGTNEATQAQEESRYNVIYTNADGKRILSAGNRSKEEAERIASRCNGSLTYTHGGGIYTVEPIEAEAQEQTKQPTEETTKTITAEPCGDMFAELAKAFITGKQAPKKPHKATETATTEETPTAEETQPKSDYNPPEPQPEKSGTGYTGEPSEVFTVAQLADLLNGKSVILGEDYERRAYIAPTLYNSARLVYSYHLGRQSAEILPGMSTEYCGCIANGNYYSTAKNADIAAELAEDINAYIKNRIQTEEQAEQHAAEVCEAYEMEKVKNAHHYAQTDSAHRHFYEDTAPELRLYTRSKDTKSADIVSYLTHPGETVERIASEYMQYNAEDIATAYIIYNKTVQALNEITSDPTHAAHAIKRMTKAINADYKTVKVTIENGETVTAETRGINAFRHCGYMSSYYIASADREKLPKDGHRAKDIQPDEIKQITHGGRILYKAS